jgi:hypothetical protein
VVYGDIGTSPLYTLKVVLDATGVWTLIIITTVNTSPWPSEWTMKAKVAFSH